MSMGTMVPLQTVTLTGTAPSVTFSDIPQTYKTLKIMVSARDDANPESSNWTSFQIAFNGSTSSFTSRAVYGTGSGTGSTTNSGGYTNLAGWTNSSVSTASTFGNAEILIPNYSGGTNKVLSSDSVSEMNATNAIDVMTATLWSNTSAITSITFTFPSGNFVSGSAFYLYGIGDQ